MKNCKVCGVELYSCGFCKMCKREENPEFENCGFCPDCVLLYFNSDSGIFPRGEVIDLSKLLEGGD